MFNYLKKNKKTKNNLPHPTFMVMDRHFIIPPRESLFQ